MENKNIPTVIFCGGMGSRMKEETEFKPKPMVLVGGKPILWHIMKGYAHYGYNDFILALGYKGDMIKDYFLNQSAFLNDLTIETSTNKVQFHGSKGDDFRITFVNTGLESLTGERLLKVKKYVTGDKFMVTYGDGVSDLNINNLVRFNKDQGTLGTITGVHPHSKYGLVRMDKQSNLVEKFDQKPMMYDYVNGGFMVLDKKSFDYFDESTMENGLIKMASERQLSAYKHEGFWKPMDTYREVEEMNKLWNEGRPWAVWEG